MNAEMKDLLNQARQKKLWLRGRYNNLWFTPDELEREQAMGSFRWGAVNWELCNPVDRLFQLKQIVERAQSELDDFKKRMINYG